MKKSKPLPMYQSVAKSVKEGKRRIRHLLSLGWCTKFLGKRGDGHPVMGYDATAVEVCAVGAIDRANLDREVEWEIRDEASRRAGMDIAKFNNKQVSVDPVLKLFR